MKKIKIGICGAGNIATSMHLPAYEKLTDLVEIVAICDITVERAKAAAEKFNIPKYFASVDEMLAGADIDAVDICTWNDGHKTCAIAAARAGKHICCEKPMAASLADAKEMYDEIKKAGVKFMLAVPNRWTRQNEVLREMVDAGEFGDVYLARAQYIRRRGTPTGWFTDKKHSGGGPVIDIGVHCIDAAWNLLGCPKPVTVSAMTAAPIGEFKTKGVDRWQGNPSPEGNFDTEDSGAGCVRFENGAMILFECSWAINGPGKSEIQIYGSKAGTIVKENPVIYGERFGHLSDDVIQTAKPNAGTCELGYFARYVAGEISEEENRYPVEMAVQMQSILQGIYDSAAAGEEVEIKL
ncbi:MAG: Gfo/Idh/MocA family oxidoreductase [Ruminococcaceae bacterium]|nr:Gfo/Idh/MocA family oxidoreductase [Oscillospiraceae bacterium]